MITRSRPAGITAAAVAVGIAAVLTGCGSQGQEGTTSSSFASAGVAPTAQHSHLGEVQREGRIQVCTTGDYRPYTYKDPKSGEWSGIDVDMARSLGKSLGAEVEFVQTSWANVVTDMDVSCDIAVGGISYTTDRAQKAAFSDTTSPDGKTPVVRCGEEEKYDTVAEINKPSVKVVTPLGGTNEKFADKNFPDAQVTKYKDNNTIFDQIVDGAADVMVTDASETRWVAHTHPELCSVHPDKPFDHFDKGYLLPQGDTVWEEYVDNWLDIASQDGTKAAAEEKWYG
ncbi:MAG: transporter substrate-binding domain-containing protein [Kocuria sp.]|uniref:Transporter substrate-binding domain-containing protein n=1 Tax=Kocuria salsicia TaxID=664639 RepID=A0ABV3KEW2_9MICC|nr:transporter substrate-binding domain-containing protein [Kocuria sp.]MDO4257430.1 transporter substrate-binding domain-containing protein [Kocuria sp.]